MSTWLTAYGRNFLADCCKVLQLKNGKKGGIFLNGPPDCGKSILVNLLTSGVDLDELGFVQRHGDNKFWLQHTVGKRLVIAEEYICSDTEADQLKLHLEGSPFATVEQKNKILQRVTKRQPWIITSNFNICVMCPRQHQSVAARLLLIRMGPNPILKRIGELFYQLSKTEHLRLLQLLLIKLENKETTDTAMINIPNFIRQ